MYGRCLCVVILLAKISFTQAETDQSQTEEVVVTGARITQDSPLKMVTVISADQIAQSAQQSVVDVLQSLGGVEISSAGGPGQINSVFIRGANSGHTLVLVDGMRLNSATAGRTALENIPIGQIQRIEIVSGPMSGLYGSDAIGGVIQIFTKSGAISPGQDVSVGAGSYNTRTVGGGINNSIGNTDLALNFGFVESDGLDATKTTIPFGQHNPDLDGYRNTNLSASVVHHIEDGNEIGINMFRSEGNTHFDGDATTDDVNHQILRFYSIYSRNQISANWRSLLRLGQSEDSSKVVGLIPSSVQSRQPQATWQNDLQLGPGTAIVGIEYLQQLVSSSTTYIQTNRNVKSVFAGYSGDYAQNGWQVNARQDDDSQFGRHTTGLLGYSYRINSELRLRADIGTAYKAPTFDDLYYPGFSNPNLLPERARNSQVGAAYQSEGHRLNVTYFQNRITDLIVFDPVANQPTNLGQATIRGMEIGYQFTSAIWRISAQMTHQTPQDDATGALLQRRAREHASVSLTRPIEKWQLGIELFANGARFDSINEDPATKMHGYGLINLLASYVVNEQWQIKARWNNLANRNYELAQNYNTPGSNASILFEYRSR